MAQVSIRINGRSYDIACDDGQEERIQALSNYVDERVKEISGAVGQIGEQRLLVMTSLLIADELGNAHEQLETCRQEQVAVAEPGSLSAAESDALAENMENMAARIEGIAAKLNQH
ncbi:cell division protein ZapA [Thalassospira lucentensis]|uniref:cell division protein ZapA n=1 Tax=Thalassospira lucentensis TaxID=168935 RepID=UPI00142DDEB2|nr:cell division protein ZapA [Thalassospira lucentensis]NIZ03630.1 cell division protein ZapA [Thalassospira lucentensis]